MTKLLSIRERDGALINNWYIACLADELGPRRTLARTIYDTPLVLFRDESGRPACFPDRCLHRHAQLSKGIVCNGTLACPYHGWTYAGDGRLTEVPSNGLSHLGEASSYRIQTFPVVEQDGCLWVWMGEGAPDPASPPFRFPHHNDPAWCQYFMITDFENEVLNLVENFMDVPHTVFVHSGWFRRRSRQPVPITVEMENGSVLVTYQQPGDRIGFSSYVLNPTKEAMLHTDRFIFPNITRVDYTFGPSSGFLIISQCTPIGTLATRVYTRILYRILNQRWLATALKWFMQFYTRQVIEQDVRIMANQGANLRQCPDYQFHHTEADIPHRAIEELRWRGATDPSSVFIASSITKGTLWI
ncbi:MAG: aromatic ring-hydroxylating dioxygenase subunit alpha [Nitrospirae bacterium]|nr:aromatic ring-hydroxylating dioxygenase subunit alpha [Nitrospirota bacterium]